MIHRTGWESSHYSICFFLAPARFLMWLWLRKDKCFCRVFLWDLLVFAHSRTTQVFWLDYFLGVVYWFGFVGLIFGLFFFFGVWIGPSFPIQIWNSSVRSIHVPKRSSSELSFCLTVSAITIGRTAWLSSQGWVIFVILSLCDLHSRWLFSLVTWEYKLAKCKASSSTLLLFSNARHSSPFQLMSLGRVCIAFLHWTLGRNLLQWGNALTVISGSADHGKNRWCLFCLTGIVSSSISVTQHTRILDEAQFVEISGTDITELRLVQFY